MEPEDEIPGLALEANPYLPEGYIEALKLRQALMELRLFLVQAIDCIADVLDEHERPCPMEER